MEFQFRYVAYAAAHLMTPAQILKHDKATYCSCMMNFVLWIQCELRSWKESHGMKADASMSDAHQAAFDLWLECKWMKQVA